MKIEYVAVSDIGKVRGNNEDNLYCDGIFKEDVSANTFFNQGLKETQSQIYAVFDGMGGIAHGEKASRLAAKSLRKIQEEDEKIEIDAIMNKINVELCREMQEKNFVMGSTAVILFVREKSVVSLNLGDSRSYLFREGVLRQLSEDHTEKNNLLRLQKEMETPIDLHLAKDVLTQHLGIEEDEFIIEPYVCELSQTKENDIFLLCSDGLTAYVTDEEIQNILDSSVPLVEKADNLKRKSLLQGGRDNITVILLQIRQI